MRVRLGRRRFFRLVGATGAGSLATKLLSGCAMTVRGQPIGAEAMPHESKVASISEGGYVAAALKPGNLADLAPVAGIDQQEESLPPEQGIGLCLSGGG